jgi:hypothetical protein
VKTATKPELFEHAAPALLTLALDAKGLDGPAVDEMFGVAEPVVDLWERGVLLPTHRQVVLVAQETGMVPNFFYRREAIPMGRTFICGRRKELRQVVEAGEVGPPVCEGCGVVCWLRVQVKGGGVMLLEGPDKHGEWIMCVVGREGRGKTRRLTWGVRPAGKGERDEEHLLRRAHTCHSTAKGSSSVAADLFSQRR